MHTARNLILGSLVAAVVLIGLLWRGRTPAPGGVGGVGAVAAAPLVVYCAAGLKVPVEAAAQAYRQATGVEVQLQYGGSGTLVSNLRVAQTGDLFIAADDSFLEMARSHGLLAETLALARQTPVLAVRRDRADLPREGAALLGSGATISFANPEAAAVGKVSRAALEQAGVWPQVAARIKVYKPTVNDVAADVKLGTVDAGLVWDSTVAQYPELVAVHDAALDRLVSRVSVSVLAFCRQPAAALRFARFLGAPEQGLAAFRAAGFAVERGEAWSATPELVLYSGGVNRVAIEDTIRRFEEREGVKVTRVYNGCGILTAQIRAGQRPDGYLACDVSFMDPVREYFLTPTNLAETRIVILVQKGNPKGVQDLAGLGKPGLAVGVPNEQQSALGALAARMLRAAGLYEAVHANVKVQTPTADLLVNQLRAGALDAAIVFEANAAAVRDALDVVTLADPAAFAVQPFAVGRETARPELTARLLAALRSAESRGRFEQSGFRWRAGTPAP